MQEVIRQHYVPRTYLKHFSRKKNGKDFISFTECPLQTENAIKEINIINMCVEKNLYTLPGATPEERMWLEKIYSDVFEKEYNRVHEMLVDPAKVLLSTGEREFIISTIISMYYRTTNWNRFADRIMDDIMDRGHYLASRSPHDHFMLGEQTISIAGKSVEDLQKAQREETRMITALTSLRQTMKLAKMRFSIDRIMVDRLNSEVDEFITSDIPVSCQNIRGRDIVPVDPTNTFTLVLDPRHSVTLIPTDAEKDRQLIHRTTYAEDVALLPVLGLNSGQEFAAQRFLLGSEAGLSAYLMARQEIEKPNPPGRYGKIKVLMEQLNRQL